MTGSFVHLRVHSAYSLSEGAIKTDKIASLAAEFRQPAVAITDTANLFGAMEFSSACTAKGVQPIIGCQLCLRVDPGPDGRAQTIAPIVLLARNQAGLANLMRLSSHAWLDAGPDGPLVTEPQLRDAQDGLFLLTGGTGGPLARLLLDGHDSEARALLQRLADSFGDALAVELHRHGTEDDAAAGPAQIALADRLGLPLVATNDAYFPVPKLHRAHDVLLCIAQGTVQANPERRRVTREHWFKPAEQMREAFADLPEACDNTLLVAKRCAVMVTSRKPMLPVSKRVSEGTSEVEVLGAMAKEGLEARIAAGVSEAPETYRERLDFELGVIGKMGFAGYFLIVADFIQWAKSNAVAVGPGRGSGAGSVVAWALTITDLDPLRFGLLFERFLNPERVSMPDFDIDFCQERRDLVINYVRDTYGADRVAQIITFGKLQARAAVRDVGRVLGIPYGYVNKVAELIPNNPAKPTTLAEAIALESRLREMRDADEQIAGLLEIALELEGLYRNASTHAAGVVIGDRPLDELVPLYRDPRSEMLVTQYSMKYVESAGLVKFDFLGLKTLTVLERAVALLKGRGILVDLATLPLDDAATYAMLARGDAGGVFQFESQGMRDVLRQMRPDRFEDLIAAVALYRPGPMANIPAYCARKHGEKWEAPHPLIQPCLAETYGIMVYQEQVMEISRILAGYSLGGADLLRRAMGKKIRSEMDAQRELFAVGARANGIEEAKAAEVFDLMARFADYGFNKSHAAAYALVAYQTAWLKANHPADFLAASMSLDLGNTDKLAAFKAEAQALSIPVLPPSINASGADFTIEQVGGSALEGGKLAIRYALAAVKKVGMAAMQLVVAARGDRPFRSLAEFADRVEGRLLNKMQIENLARAGAFDSLEANRKRVVMGAEAILRRAQSASEARGSAQTMLFGGGEPAPLKLPADPDWLPMERLAFEAEAVGFHLSAHPLDAYRKVLGRLRVVPIAEVEKRSQAGSLRLKLAGIVSGVKERTTRSGSRMAWVRLSDTSGSMEVTFFSEVLGRARGLLDEGVPLLVTADTRIEGEALRITAQDVEPLDRAAAMAGAGLRLVLDRAEAVGHVRAALAREGRGRGRVILVPRLGAGEEVEVALPGAFNVTPLLSQAMRVLPGVVEVHDL